MPRMDALHKSSYTPALIVVLIIAAFFLGSLTTKVKYLEKTASETKVAGTQTQAQPQAAQPPAPTVDINTIKALFTDKHIMLGNKDSKNLLVEIADPSCPYCSIAAGHNPELNKQAGNQFLLVADGGTYIPPVPEMKKLVESGKAALVWIYYPGHGNGEMGTKALYCAHEQGKFWPVHDKLMSKEGYDLLNNQVKNDKTKSQEVANFLSDVFDANEMKACLDSGKYDSKIQENTAIGTNLLAPFGQRAGTPSFYININGFPGAVSWKDMQSAVKN